MHITRRHLIGGGLVLGAAGVLGGVDGALLAPPARAAVGDVIGTAAWGARQPSQPITLLTTCPVKIIVHHTASPNTSDLSRAHAFSLARSIQNNHMDSRGFIDTGQHFTVTRGGFTLEGRHRSVEALSGGSRQVVSAHCTAQNTVAIGIENEGTYTAAAPPAALYGALVTLCATICAGFGLRAYQIYGHRDFQSTDCPGDLLYARLGTLRADVADAVGGDPAHPVWPVLRRGDTGERVRSLQYLLRGTGAAVTPDGTFSAATETAVRSFQAARGATADGVAGRQTWNHLAEPVATGARGDAVTAIQRQLAARGIAVAADGAFGPATAAAVRTFQTRSRLPGDGVVDARTWSRLVA